MEARAHTGWCIRHGVHTVASELEHGDIALIETNTLHGRLAW